MKLEATLSKEEVETILGYEIVVNNKVVSKSIRDSITNWISQRFDIDINNVNVQLHWNTSGISAIATLYLLIES